MTADVLPGPAADNKSEAARAGGSSGTWRYVGWRLLNALGVVAGVVVVTFLLLHLIPGDPAQSMLGNRATPEAVAALRAQWGLDRPLWTQFGSFLARLFTTGDTGDSLFYQVPARELIFPRIGVTLELIFMAGVICVVITVPLALWAAIRKDRAADQVIRIIPSVGAGLPALWVGLLLIIIFGVHLQWFPVGGAGPGPWLTFRGLVLPAFTAAIAISPVLIRSLRAGMLEVLESDYIAAARAKSLSEPRVLLAHVARNAAVPTLNMAYDQPLSWYRAHFPLTTTAARRSRPNSAAVTFESSPYYLYHPLAAARIAHDLPDVRLLVLVRDPVERAYSAHSHELARGFEDVADFATALELEPERLRGEEVRLRTDPQASSVSFRHHAYVQRGQYVDHLERLAAEVGRDRIHVIDSHQFFAEPLPIYHGVLDFLELPHGQSPTFDQHNARSRSELSDDLRATLSAHFEPYDRALESWLGTTPSWRRTDVSPRS